MKESEFSLTMIIEDKEPIFTNALEEEEAKVLAGLALFSEYLEQDLAKRLPQTPE